MSKNYAGDYPASHTAVTLTFDSFAAATGASSATSSFVAGDVQIYKDGGTTQRSSSAGITVSTSFDSSTGLQMIVIDLSDNTDAGFYAAGHEYDVAVADVTIDGQTVRFWAGSFSIERAGGILALIKGNAIKVDVNTVKTQSVTCAAGVTVGAFVGNATAAIAVDASGRLDVSKLSGTSQTARDIGASVLLSTGTGTGQLDFTSGIVKANLTQILGTLLTETAGQIAAAFKKFFNIATPAATMDHLVLVDTVTTYTGNTPQTGDAYARIGANGISLSAIPDLTGVTTLLSRLSSARAGYLDNINNAALSTTAAQTGDGYARLGAPAGASVSADIAAAKVDTAAIKLVTIKLDSMITFGVGSPSDYAFNITAMENAPTGSGASAATIAAAVWDEARSGHVSAGTFGQGVVVNSIGTDAVDANALKADAVTEIQSGLSTLNAAGVRTAIGLASANMDTQLAAIQADTDDIQTRIPAALTGAGNMKADMLAISNATESADRLERSTLAIVLGTCTTGGTTTSIVASAVSPTSAVNDQFNGRIITFDKDTTTAALRGQATDITGYAHASLTFTVTALTTAPSSGDTFTIT